MFLLALILILDSAMCYRVRGSSLLSFTGGRALKLAIGSMPVALACLFFGVVWWVVLLVWATTAAADTSPHAPYQGASNLDQVLMMGLLGAVTLVPAGAAIGFSTPYDMLGIVVTISGFFAASLGYYAGNNIPCTIVGARQGPELGEVMFGGFRVLFVFLAFLNAAV